MRSGVGSSSPHKQKTHAPRSVHAWRVIYEEKLRSEDLAAIAHYFLVWTALPVQEATMRGLRIHLVALMGVLILGGCSFGLRTVAVATADPGQGYAPLEVVFDASSPSSTAGEIVSYNWDFGDGATATEPAPVHTYKEKGTYRVVLEVLDSGGHTVLDELTVRVFNRAPHAEFHYSPYGAPRDHPITFDASDCYDPDGSIAEYVWEFGDGTTANGVRVEHIFPQRLEYEVTLTVIDDDGTENKTVRTVIVEGCDTCG